MISAGFKTDKGKTRERNEDALFVLPKEQLYIVADGVGGHNSGEVASRTCVSLLAGYAASNPISSAKDCRSLRLYFTDAFSKANSFIYEKASEGGENSGMATTAVLTYIRGEEAFIVNVGDSRAYLLRGGRLKQLTEDHTCVQELVKNGFITKEEAKRRPDKNLITRAVGGDRDIKPDFFRLSIVQGDIIIMCTDGLYGEVSDKRIAELAALPRPMPELAKLLLDEANKNGGTDNITVICIKI